MSERSAPPSRRRRTIVVVTLALALVAAGTGALAYAFGPGVGVYFLRPSPEQYAQQALDLMQERALFAEGDRWERVRAEADDAVAGARSYEETYATIMAALRVAGGEHSAFFPPDEVEQRVDDSESSFLEPSVERRGGVTTVAIPPLGFVSEELQEQYARSGSEQIQAVEPETCGWIVDLRGNVGGDMYPMISSLTALLPSGPAMFFEDRDGNRTTVTMQADGGGINGDTITAIAETAPSTQRPIAVLQDVDTASSGEAVATVFRGLADVRSFGSETAGFTTGNEVHVLADGAFLVLTTTVYVDRDGVSLGGEPIAPDQVVGTLKAHEDAAEWLASQGCG